MRNEKMKLIGLIVSLVATIAIWTAFLVSSLPDIVGDTLAVIWIVGSIAGYILGGGIKVALGKLHGNLPSLDGLSCHFLLIL